MEKKHIQVNSVYADSQESTPWNKKHLEKSKKTSIPSIVFFVLIVLSVISLSVTFYFVNKNTTPVSSTPPLAADPNLMDKINKDKWLQKQLNLANLPYLPSYGDNSDSQHPNESNDISKDNVEKNKGNTQKPVTHDSSISEDLLIKYEPETFIEIVKEKMQKKQEETLKNNQ